MKKCNYCGAEQDDDNIFCTECGKEFSKGIICPYCGTSVNEGDVFCTECGKKIDEVPQAVSTETTQQEVPTVEVTYKEKSVDDSLSDESTYYVEEGLEMDNQIQSENDDIEYYFDISEESKTWWDYRLYIFGGLFLVLLLGAGWWLSKSSKTNVGNQIEVTPDTAEIEKPMDDNGITVVDSDVADTVAVDLLEANDDADEKRFVTEDEENNNDSDDNSSKESDKDNVIVEVMPSFPGGEEALKSFVSSNVRYPQIALENRVEGKVVVTFIVERDGSITNVNVEGKVDPSLDREAVRVIKSMPRWIPGTQNGEPVRVKYTVPVTFSIIRY